MPEGDTIFRVASRLRPVLDGRCVVDVQGSRYFHRTEALQGHCVSGIESRGKHLLIHFDNDRTLHSHLGMHGSWRVTRSSARVRRSNPHTAVVLMTDHHRIVCVRPQVFELLSGKDLLRHKWLNRLGPDLLGPAPDQAQIIDRFRASNAQPIGEVVMDQAVVCGIGNVYKSEVLFLEGINPLAPVQDLSDDQIVALVQTAVRLLRRNVTMAKRTTRFRSTGPRVWVYGRGGEHCLRCDATIRTMRQGTQARSTWYCPDCQA